MSKIRRKVTVEKGSSVSSESTEKRKPSVFERLGPGASRRYRDHHGDEEDDPTDVCRNWLKTGTCNYGPSCRFSHPSYRQRRDDSPEDLRHKMKHRKGRSRDRESPTPERRRSPEQHRSRREKDAKVKVVKSAVIVKSSQTTDSESESDRGAGGSGEFNERMLDFEQELTLMKRRQELQRELSKLQDEEHVDERENVFINIPKQVKVIKDIPSVFQESSSSSDSDYDHKRKSKSKEKKKYKAPPVEHSPKKKTKDKKKLKTLASPPPVPLPKLHHLDPESGDERFKPAKRDMPLDIFREHKKDKVKDKKHRALPPLESPEPVRSKHSLSPDRKSKSKQTLLSPRKLKGKNLTPSPEVKKSKKKSPLEAKEKVLLEPKRRFREEKVYEKLREDDMPRSSDRYHDTKEDKYSKTSLPAKKKDGRYLGSRERSRSIERGRQFEPSPPKATKGRKTRELPPTEKYVKKYPRDSSESSAERTKLKADWQKKKSAPKRKYESSSSSSDSDSDSSSDSSSESEYETAKISKQKTLSGRDTKGQGYKEPTVWRDEPVEKAYDARSRQSHDKRRGADDRYSGARSPDARDRTIEEKPKDRRSLQKEDRNFDRTKERRPASPVDRGRRGKDYDDRDRRRNRSPTPERSLDPDGSFGSKKDRRDNRGRNGSPERSNKDKLRQSPDRRSYQSTDDRRIEDRSREERPRDRGYERRDDRYRDDRGKQERGSEKVDRTDKSLDYSERDDRSERGGERGRDRDRMKRGGERMEVVERTDRSGDRMDRGADRSERNDRFERGRDRDRGSERSPDRGRERERNMERVDHSFERGDRSMDRADRTMDRRDRSQERGDRSIDRGGRSMDRGDRSTDRGDRSVDRGDRSVDRGDRSVDRGDRSVDRGDRSIDRGDRIQNRGDRSQDRGNRSMDRVGERSMERDRGFERELDMDRGRNRSLERGHEPSIERGRDRRDNDRSRGDRSMDRRDDERTRDLRGRERNVEIREKDAERRGDRSQDMIPELDIRESPLDGRPDRRGSPPRDFGRRNGSPPIGWNELDMFPDQRKRGPDDPRQRRPSPGLPGPPPVPPIGPIPTARELLERERMSPGPGQQIERFELERMLGNPLEGWPFPPRREPPMGGRGRFPDERFGKPTLPDFPLDEDLPPLDDIPPGRGGRGRMQGRGFPGRFHERGRRGWDHHEGRGFRRRDEMEDDRRFGDDRWNRDRMDRFPDFPGRGPLPFPEMLGRPPPDWEDRRPGDRFDDRRPPGMRPDDRMRDDRRMPPDRFDDRGPPPMLDLPDDHFPDRRKRPHDGDAVSPAFKRKRDGSPTDSLKSSRSDRNKPREEQREGEPNRSLDEETKFKTDRYMAELTKRKRSPSPSADRERPPEDRERKRHKPEGRGTESESHQGSGAFSDWSDDPDEILTKEERNKRNQQDGDDTKKERGRHYRSSSLSSIGSRHSHKLEKLEKEPASPGIPVGENDRPIKVEKEANGSEKQNGVKREARTLSAEGEDEKGVDMEYDPISDDELDELIANEDGGGEPGEDGAKVKNTAIVDALDIDWSSLVKVPQPKPPISGSALKRFSPANVLARIGVSKAYAGEAFMEKIKQKCQAMLEEEAKLEAKENGETEDNVKQDPGEQADEKDNLSKPATVVPKFEFLSDIAFHHAKEVTKRRERANLMSDLGPYRRALCARRDLMIRRQLCKVERAQDQPPIYNVQIDRDLVKLSAQLLKQAKQASHEKLMGVSITDVMSPTEPLR